MSGNDKEYKYMPFLKTFQPIQGWQVWMQSRHTLMHFTGMYMVNNI